MHLLMLALIATLTVNEVTLDTDIIENTEDQWIASGYRIAEELILDPGEYGPPINTNDIGFHPFFVDTSDGEKWRIVLAYEGEIVVLQEDEPERRFPVSGELRSMISSANGRYVLFVPKAEEQTPEEIAQGGYSPPEHRVVLLDTDTGEQVTGTGISGGVLIGNDGSLVAIRRNAIKFYDSELNLLGTASNCIPEMGGSATGYASDGSLLVRVHTEDYSDPESRILRACDRYGNILWVTDNEHYGYPMVSEHGEYVFVLKPGSLLCLDGSDGRLLWEQSHPDRTVYLTSASPSGAACAYPTDLTPAGVRENPFRDRYLITGMIESDDIARITRVLFQSEQIRSMQPVSVTGEGFSLWLAWKGPGLDLSNYKLCAFSPDGTLILKRKVSDTGSQYNITTHSGRVISRNGPRLLWFDNQGIHIVTLEEKGGAE
ncbi:MAG: hypothetical protein GF388_00420 [Candidatus Aegiribacteria sp.]|nr:hypothetical protein [Candidatus Aegiribacteria sp.]